MSLSSLAVFGGCQSQPPDPHRPSVAVGHPQVSRHGSTAVPGGAIEASHVIQGEEPEGAATLR